MGKKTKSERDDVESDGVIANGTERLKKRKKRKSVDKEGERSLAKKEKKRKKTTEDYMENEKVRASGLKSNGVAIKPERLSSTKKKRKKSLKVQEADEDTMNISHNKESNSFVPANPDSTKVKRSSSKKEKKRKKSVEEDVMEISLDEEPNGTTSLPPSLTKKERPKKKKSDKPAGDSEQKLNGAGASKRQSSSGAKSFPLVNDANVPTRQELKSMASDQQLACFQQLGESCERILRLIDDTQTICGLWREKKKSARDTEDASAVLEDAIVADMAKLKGVPVARRYVEMMSWKRLKRFTDSELAYIEKLEIGEKHRTRPNGDVSAANNGVMESQSEEFVSAKKAHLKQLTSDYAEDLEKIRGAESLDVVGVQTLLKCLDETAQLYATVVTSK